MLLRAFIAVGFFAGLTTAAAATPQAAPSHELAAITNAAERGNAGAELLLGLAYLEGKYGLAPDNKMGFRWLKAAAEGDQAYAQYRLGNLYQQGSGTAKNMNAALRWWRRSAEQGFESAQLALGETYLGQAGIKPDYREAEHWLALAANQGNAQAQYQLGRMYRLGHGVPQDLQRGKDWLERAVARGHSDAIKLLQFLADVGEEASTVHEQTGDELKRRSAAGEVEAQYQLALRYETGAWGVQRDDREALRWFQTAADRGYPPALRALAHVYGQGLLGVKPDSAKAAALRERANRADGRGG